MDMDGIFETRKILIPDEDHPEYYEILKGLESNKTLSHTVVLFNDDKTPMVFVSWLYLYFQDIEAREAEKRMMLVHETGSGELLTTSRSLAGRIRAFITSHARNEGHPLRVEVHDI